MSFSSMMTLKCPQCEEGKQFKGLFSMYENCPQCGYKYEKEQGYFTAAIFIGNFLYGLIVAPTILIMAAIDEPVWKIALVLGGFSLFAVPLIFRYARSIWMYMDYITEES
ncbi:MAG: DUF983 domain-containing protein [Calditrichaeota bacterium]|nr:MAG: DUF983 domain-containing protein [Calditrichota bacterium]